MGSITKRLTHGQFEDAGEAIESEFQKLQDKIEALDKNVLESLRKQWKRLYSFEARLAEGIKDLEKKL